MNDRGNSGAGQSLTLGMGTTGGGHGLPGQISWELDSNATDIGVSSAQKINDGNWHSIVATWSAPSGTAVNTSQFKIYIDGQGPVSVTTGSTGSATSPLSGLGDTLIGHHAAWGTYWPGDIDDVAIWDVALTPSEIQAIYERQSPKYSGVLTSRVMDAFDSGQVWQSIAASTTLPFYKELPNSSASESSTSYSSQTAGLTTGLIALWHLDEASGTTGANSVVDSSGNSNDATPTNVTFGADGKFSTAASFNGTSSSISLPNAIIQSRTTLSIQAWFQTATSGIILGYQNTAAPSSAGDYVPIFYIDSNGYLRSEFWNGSVSPITSTVKVDDDKWHQVVIAAAGNMQTVYLDGKAIGTLSGTIQQLNMTYSQLGNGKNQYWPSAGNTYFTGEIDEVGIWNRALSASEVLELYRRGANRIEYQIRTCSMSDCSDQNALTSAGEGWKGPDNTQLSYFSEIQNNTVINSTGAPTGSVNVDPLDLLFSTFTSAGTGLSVNNNRFFQYRVIFESDDSQNLCTYGGSAAPCSPELKVVTIGPNHYDTTVQTITSDASIGSAYETLDANGFSETLGTNGCSAGARYALSGDGTNFWYWDGSAWAGSSSYSTASSASTLSANLNSFPAAAGTGTLQVETFLKSNGTSACEVNNLQLTGQKY